MTSGPRRTSKRPALALALALLVPACQPAPAVTELSGSTMGTTWSAIYRSTANAAEGEVLEIEALLEEINQSLSTYIPDSVISRINAADDPALWTPVDAHFETVFRAARSVYEDTGAAFNPAVGPLVRAWGFGPEGAGELPSPERVAELLPLVAFEAFELRASPPAVRKTLPEAELDMNAIAKGYGVDALGDLIASWGVADYFVEIGGEVRTRGQHPEGRAWRVGIERPSPVPDSPPEVQTVATVSDAALATSGNYRNFRNADGTRIVHILDPRTGYPEESALLAVSVLAADTMTADAYATAFMVMGFEEARRLVENMPGLEAYFIRGGPDGVFTEYRSPGFPDSTD